MKAKFITLTLALMTMSIAVFAQRFEKPSIMDQGTTVVKIYVEDVQSGKLFAYGEYRKYKNKKHAAPIGRYNGVYTQLASNRQSVLVGDVSQAAYDHVRRRNSVKLGVMTGKQWAWGPKVSFDMWLGAHGGYHFISSFNYMDAGNLDKQDYINDIRDGRDFSNFRLGLRTGIAIGYRF